MTTDLWDTLPEYAPDGRKQNPFRTDGPAHMPNLTWHEYFQWIKGKTIDTEAVEEEEEEVEYDIVITQEAEEFDEPTSALATWVSRAHKAGWEISSLAHAFSEQEQPPFKSGTRAGEARPRREYEAQWLHAKKGGHRASFYYLLNQGKVVAGKASRHYDGQVKSDAEMKTLIEET